MEIKKEMVILFRWFRDLNDLKTACLFVCESLNCPVTHLLFIGIAGQFKFYGTFFAYIFQGVSKNTIL
jgi:hypothetical protein